MKYKKGWKNPPKRKSHTSCFSSRCSPNIECPRKMSPTASIKSTAMVKRVSINAIGERDRRAALTAMPDPAQITIDMMTAKYGASFFTTQTADTAS